MNQKKFTVGLMPTNCYVIDDDGKAVIVDPGGGYGKIGAYLEESGIKPIAVLLTHGHFDHISDVFKWKKDGATVYIHEDDAECLYSPEKSLASMVGLTIPPVREFVTFTDEETLSIGNIELKVMHTPGHTVGSCCFILPDGNVLTGDTIMCETYGRTDFPGGSDLEIKRSITEKLFALEGDRILYPGHGDSTTLKHEQLLNPVLYL